MLYESYCMIHTVLETVGHRNSFLPGAPTISSFCDVILKLFYLRNVCPLITQSDVKMVKVQSTIMLQPKSIEHSDDL